ncbi:glycosyltransferase [bacterium]
MKVNIVFSKKIISFFLSISILTQTVILPDNLYNRNKIVSSSIAASTIFRENTREKQNMILKIADIISALYIEKKINYDTVINFIEYLEKLYQAEYSSSKDNMQKNEIRDKLLKTFALIMFKINYPDKGEINQITFLQGGYHHIKPIKIETSKGTYIWKYIGQDFNKAQYIVSYNNHLFNKKIPVARFYKKKIIDRNAPFINEKKAGYGKGYYVLMQFLDEKYGKFLNNKEVKPIHYYKRGKMIARMQNALKDFKPLSETCPIIKLRDDFEGKNNYLKLIKLKEGKCNYKKLINTKIYKQYEKLFNKQYPLFLQRFNNLKASFNMGYIHDDFHIGNVKFKKEELCGIIDPCKAGYGPIIEEFHNLMIGMNMEFTYDGLMQAIAGYQQNADNKFSDNEIKGIIESIRSRFMIFYHPLIFPFAEDEILYTKKLLKDFQNFADKLTTDKQINKFIKLIDKQTSDTGKKTSSSIIIEFIRKLKFKAEKAETNLADYYRASASKKVQIKITQELLKSHPDIKKIKYREDLNSIDLLLKNSIETVSGIWLGASIEDIIKRYIPELADNIIKANVLGEQYRSDFKEIGQNIIIKFADRIKEGLHPDEWDQTIRCLLYIELAKMTYKESSLLNFDNMLRTALTERIVKMYLPGFQNNNNFIKLARQKIFDKDINKTIFIRLDKITQKALRQKVSRYKRKFADYNDYFANIIYCDIFEMFNDNGKNIENIDNAKGLFVCDIFKTIGTPAGVLNFQKTNINPLYKSQIIDLFFNGKDSVLTQLNTIMKKNIFIGLYKDLFIGLMAGKYAYMRFDNSGKILEHKNRIYLADILYKSNIERFIQEKLKDKDVLLNISQGIGRFIALRAYSNIIERTKTIMMRSYKRAGFDPNHRLAGEIINGVYDKYIGIDHKEVGKLEEAHKLFKQIDNIGFDNYEACKEQDRLFNELEKVIDNVKFNNKLLYKDDVQGQQLNRKKVVIVSHAFLGGAAGLEKYMLIQIRELLIRNKDMEIHIVYPQNRDKLKELREINFGKGKIYLHTIDNFDYEISLGLKLKEIEKLKKIDCMLMHTWGNKHVYAGAFYAKMNNIPIICFEHGGEWAKEYIYPVQGIMQSINLHRMVDFTGVVAEPGKRVIEYLAGAQANPKIIGPMLNIDTFKSIARQKARQTLKITSNKKIILVPSRIIDDKGTLDVLKAFNTAYKGKKRDDFMIILLGSGSKIYIQQLNEYAKKCGFSHIVKMYKNGCFKSLDQIINETSEKQYLIEGSVQQSKLKEFYAASDVIVLPTKREGLGLVIIEPVFMGIPVITYLVGGTLDAIGLKISEYEKNKEQKLFFTKSGIGVRILNADSAFIREEKRISNFAEALKIFFAKRKKWLNDYNRNERIEFINQRFNPNNIMLRFQEMLTEPVICKNLIDRVLSRIRNTFVSMSSNKPLIYAEKFLYMLKYQRRLGKNKLNIIDFNSMLNISKAV